MTAIPEPGPTPLVFVDEPGKSYSEQLAAYEARRRAADKILLAKMLQPREPMNPPS